MIKIQERIGHTQVAVELTAVNHRYFHFHILTFYHPDGNTSTGNQARQKNRGRQKP